MALNQQKANDMLKNSFKWHKQDSKSSKKRNYDEDKESQAFHEWLNLMKIPHDYSSHGEERTYQTIIRNGKEIRICAAGARLKKLGTSAGFPDFNIPVPNKYHHGLYIEMKSQSGKPTKAQIEWIDLLIELGYCAAICKGWDEAQKLTEKYMQTASKYHRKTT